jgi:hypothetical protein
MRLRRLLPVALLAVASASLPAQAAPQQLPLDLSGRATPNVQPLAHFSTAGAGVSGAFLDKSTYVLSVADEAWNGTNAPSTVTGGLQVYDVSDVKKPVLQSTFPLPNFQNEDIALSGRRHFAVISQDSFGAPGRVELVDLTHPKMPSLLSITTLTGGAGHTSTLVDNDQYLWVSGGRGVVVVDVRDLKAPKVLGEFATPAGESNPSYTGVHDAEVDRFGEVSVYGSGGTAVYRTTKDPLAPALQARISKADNTSVRNGLIHHGGKRLSKDLWLITEEDYSPGCKTDGAFEVWRIDRKAKLLRFVSMWDAPEGADDSGPLTQADYCSSHWFTVNANNVVADGWYGAGVRFLDVSDPKHIRPIGVWAGDSTTASQAVFAPGSNDVVYVADYTRGLDVITINKGGRGAKTVTPSDERRVGSAAPATTGLGFKVSFVPSKKWGWSCAVPQGVHQH